MLAVLCCSRAPQAVLQGETPEAPVKLTAAQSGPWHRPANYRPSRMDSAPHVEYPDRGPTKETQINKNELTQREKGSP